MKVNVSTILNDRTLEASIYPNQTLLEFLRDDLFLKGSEKGLPVRLLHAGDDHGGQGIAVEQSASDRIDSARLSLG